MTISLVQFVGAAGLAVSATRSCVTCAHHASTHLRLLGMRCLHPLVPSADPIYGLPALCADARGGLVCGPNGDLHSSLQGANTKPQ